MYQKEEKQANQEKKNETVSETDRSHPDKPSEQMKRRTKQQNKEKK